MALEKQVQIYGIDTGNFYTNREARLHWKNQKIKIEKNKLKNEQKNNLRIIDKLKEIAPNNIITSIVSDVYLRRNEMINIWCEFKNKEIDRTKDDLKTLLKNKVDANEQSNGKHHKRILNENTLTDKHIISMFDSSLTRIIGLEHDKLTDAFMVIQVYYYDMIKDLIYYGYEYKGEKYIYFTSSAGQIRTKKTVFIKESLWNKYEKTLMCGLTIDSINAKGGNNPNKHLAYMALSNSATDEWYDFDIDKTIVIKDFETNVYGTYDLIDDIDCSITRTTGYAPIPHTDGAGMILPFAFGVSQKNKMVRLPWVKGLLGVFDYVEFIKENNCSPIIKDIYGKEWNIIEDDIQIIFTESQFKMYKYYSSWDEYKTYFKQYDCSAGYTNEEEDRIKDAKINYQMLQTLIDFKDEDIVNISKRSIDKLNNLTSSIKNMKDAFGVTPYNQNMSPIQQAIDIYPNLLNDEYLKNRLRDIKKSLIKKYKSGKLEVKGKYTFILPDFYAACEYWFMGNENPNGLLDDGEVYCSLFKTVKEVDCLRSPHLFIEHPVRCNTAYCNNDITDKQRERLDKLDKWYTTKALYTSCKDMISRILQFDTDGDKSLVVADKPLVELAKKNMQGIVPLFYNMKKASSSILNNKIIYRGLELAFTGSNIGQYSNNITKIWNSDIFINGNEQERQDAIDMVKITCMLNNFCIDYAKTLYMPTIPSYIEKKMKLYIGNKVPHFFTYAKDREDTKVSAINNSFVNKLDNIIPNPRINCRKINLGTINYKMLMNNPNLEIDLNSENNIVLLLNSYHKLNKEYYNKIDLKDDNIDITKRTTISSLRQSLMYKNISKEIKQELSQFGYNDIEITDILVKYLYDIKKSKHKEALWFCYGNHILDNLRRNVKKPTKTIQCIDCGEWLDISKTNRRTCRCEECQRKIRLRQKSENERRRRLEKKVG